MSDVISADTEEDTEYHSAFNLALGPRGLQVLKWLAIGHLVFVVGLGIALALQIDRGNVWVTPLFGLPLLWVERNNRPMLKALVFVVGFTAAHYLAVELAIQNAGGDITLVPGLIGGAVGAAISLIACAVFGLFRPGTPTLVFAAFGTVLLAIDGSLGVYMYLSTGKGDGLVSEWLQMLWIYTPWQLLFAYVLAKTLKPMAVR